MSDSGLIVGAIRGYVTDIPNISQGTALDKSVKQFVKRRHVRVYFTDGGTAATISATICWDNHG